MVWYTGMVWYSWYMYGTARQRQHASGLGLRKKGNSLRKWDMEEVTASITDVSMYTLRMCKDFK